MAELFVPLAQAAQFEGVDYEVIKKRFQRNPTAFKTREEPRVDGGRARVLVALSSLSSKARKAYKAVQEVNGGDAVENERPKGIRPWYVDVDYHWFIEAHRNEYYHAVELKNHVLELLAYDETGRTEHAEEFAQRLGISSRSLYRYAKEVTKASAWARELEAESRRNHEYLQVLCLCRKPRDSGTFPSLSEEMKAVIENIYFDKMFRQNLGTRQMCYEELERRCRKSSIEVPSYQTVARYINSLRNAPGGKSVEFYLEKGERDWKMTYMIKGERDLTQLPIMGLVMGDEHTFDLNVSYIAANGKPVAVRPKLITWIEVRSRRLIGYAICRDANAQDIKNSFAKFAREFGVPRDMLIDNGKDYTAEEMTGHERGDRMILDAEIKGFYKAMGVRNVYRSLPYQAYDKGVMERAFGTVCQGFSKWFNAYVGTLTGSKTYAKVKKDINKMLERGELFTMEEFFALFDQWVTEVYNQRRHRGLVNGGEQFITPATLYHGAEERYTTPAPPDSYITMLLMKSKAAAVKSTGIRFGRRTYHCNELAPYINSKVQIRYMPDNDSCIYAFSHDGELIGEIPLAEKLNPVAYEDTEQLKTHKSAQNQQRRTVREMAKGYQTPFEEREGNEEATPRLIGGVDLTIGKKPENNVTALPTDKQYRQTMKGKKKEPVAPNQFIQDLGDDALKQLREMA